MCAVYIFHYIALKCIALHYIALHYIRVAVGSVEVKVLQQTQYFSRIHT